MTDRSVRNGPWVSPAMHSVCDLRQLACVEDVQVGDVQVSALQTGIIRTLTVRALAEYFLCMLQF
jgi:hypothetical protein